MNRRHLDLLVIGAIVPVALIAVLLQVNEWLRAAFALPLVIVLPGYALAAALFPGGALSAPERLLFTFGGSLATGVLGGLLLNLTPWGLNPASWTVLLAFVTVAAALTALLRRERAVTAVDTGSGERRVSVTPLQGALLAAALLVAAGAVGVARVGADQQPNPPFTQLWLLPAPEEGAAAVRLGVQSMEEGPIDYRLQLKQGNTVVREWTGIHLKPGEKWETTLSLPGSSQSGAVKADLFRVDLPNVPAPYRSVTLQSAEATK